MSPRWSKRTSCSASGRCCAKSTSRLCSLCHSTQTAKQLAGETSLLKAKHIDVRLKFVYDHARHGVVAAQYVRSELQLADLLTKALDTAKLKCAEVTAEEEF